MRRDPSKDEMIKSAVLAERERCAHIAAEWRCSISEGSYSAAEVDEVCNTVGPNIASEILREQS